MTTQLEQLSSVTVVVADTGDINSIKKFLPTDATTNPSLLFKAASMPEYRHLVDDAVAYGAANSTPETRLEVTMDKLSVNFGVEILSLVPGVVSTEVDARLSFDKAATLAKARALIELYSKAGVSKDRVLIKIASTWEGLSAARELELEGIHCNLTLLFSMAQAQVAAENSTTLISPFVGRILDWHKKSTGKDSYPAVEDPGVISVTEIYNYYKTHGYSTVVMGASFRNKDEILQLAGCDKLTIAPTLLEELKSSTESFPVLLSTTAACSTTAKMVHTEASFRWAMNEDPMATEKLAEGIRNFAKDTLKLEAVVLDIINQ